MCGKLPHLSRSVVEVCWKEKDGRTFFFLVGSLAMHMVKPYWKIPFILKGKQGSTRQLSSMVIRLAGIVISLELYTKNKRDMTLQCIKVTHVAQKNDFPKHSWSLFYPRVLKERSAFYKYIFRRLCSIIRQL